MLKVSGRSPHLLKAMQLKPWIELAVITEAPAKHINLLGSVVVRLKQCDYEDFKDFDLLNVIGTDKYWDTIDAPNFTLRLMHPTDMINQNQ